MRAPLIHHSLPLPQCLPGASSGQVHAGAAPPRAALPAAPRRSPCAARLGTRLGSPRQPAARGRAGALLLFTHSLLRPRGRRRRLESPRALTHRRSSARAGAKPGAAAGCCRRRGACWDLESPPQRPPPCVSRSQRATRPTTLRGVGPAAARGPARGGAKEPSAVTSAAERPGVGRMEADLKCPHLLGFSSSRGGLGLTHAR